MRKRKFLITNVLILCFFILISTSALAADRFNSIVKVDKTKIEASEDKKAKFTIYLRNNNKADLTGNTVYVASDRGKTENFYLEGAKKFFKKANFYEFVDEDKDGKIEFHVSSGVAGKARIAVGFTDKVYDYLNDSKISAAGAKVIATKIIDFTAGNVAKIECVDISSKSDSMPRANGIDYCEITFRVVNDSGASVEGEKVIFDANQTNVTFDKKSAVSDEVGEVKVRVYSTECYSKDELEVTAKIGNTKGTTKGYKVKKGSTNKLQFDPPQPHYLKVKMSTPNNVTIDKDMEEKDFKITACDRFDNNIYYSNKNYEIEKDISVDVIKEPEDSDIETELKISMGSPRLYIKNIQEEGYYCIRLSPDNGDYLDICFTVKEQGEVTRFELEYKETVMPLGGKTKIPKIIRYDKEDVEYELTESDISSDIIFSVSDSSIVSEISPKGELTFIKDDPKKDYTGEILITAIDKANDLTANYLLQINREPVNIRLAAPTLIKTGETAKVRLQLIDREGRVVSLGQKYSVADPTFVIEEKPEDSFVKTYKASMFSNNMREKGQTNIEVTCNKVGTVKLAVVLDITQGSGKNKKTVHKFAQTVLVNFGEKKAAFTDEVKMYIGVPGYYADGNLHTMDGAPFIDNNRTYVPLRATAELFGAEVKWQSDTQEIILDNQEKEVSIKVGSNLVKVSNSPTILADGTPQILDGRTYVPFRVIGEVFGAFVDPIIDEDNNVTGVQFRLYEDDDDEEDDE